MASSSAVEGSGGPSERAAQPEGAQVTPSAQDAVVSSWLEMSGLMERAAKGTICIIPQNGMDNQRQTVIDNADLLEPVIASYGP